MIAGNGPSALILSYILHGHIPVYDQTSPHPDPLLHQKLKECSDLLNADVDHLTEHFSASRLSYSTQALPINVLLDTLIRPLGETDDNEDRTCIKWHYDPTRAVPHVVVGNTTQTGGQWVNNPVKASWDIGSLSYANMLSLPGYEFSDFHLERYGERLPFASRPSRREVAEYFATYPHRVGIADAIHYGETLSGIKRAGSGFFISSHRIFCTHLVLASGVFTSPIQPGPLLQPLLSLPNRSYSSDPLLVIGSGFSAADVILSTNPDRKIIHIYKWSPTKSPSPLKACHHQAYPEYAGMYKKMKLAAVSAKSSHGRNNLKRIPSSTVDTCRDWATTYEGLPNTTILDVEVDGDSAIITFQKENGDCFKRKVSGLAYLVGRRGSLDYLEPKLRQQVCPQYDAKFGLSGRNMREQASEDLEVAENVFIIGSLTGDTLIRFSYGGCTYAAGKIMENVRARNSPKQEPLYRCTCKHNAAKNNSQFIPMMKGLDGHTHIVEDYYGEILSLDRRKDVAQ